MKNESIEILQNPVSGPSDLDVAVGNAGSVGSAMPMSAMLPAPALPPHRASKEDRVYGVLLVAMLSAIVGGLVLQAPDTVAMLDGAQALVVSATLTLLHALA